MASRVFPGGWQIRLGDLLDSFYFSATFYDSKYGDQDRALAAAQRVRNKQIKRPEFISWIVAHPVGANNTTGFFGVACGAHWKWDSRRATHYRKAAFYVRDESIKRGAGPAHAKCISFAKTGAWYGYRQAVKFRAAVVGQRVSPRVIAERYDEIFLPNWRATLEDLGVEWRRD